MRRLILVALVVLSAGCAQDNPTIVTPEATTEEQPLPEPGEDIAVTAVGYEFQGMPVTLAEGEYTFSLENPGQEPHVLYLFLITGEQSVEELLELPQKQVSKFTQAVDSAKTKPGESDEFTAGLVPGRFGYVCFVESPDGTSHALLGMRGELTVA